jgi:hypothetical protein
MFKLTGVVKVINPTVQVTEKFAKREFVLTDASSMYPQDIIFQMAKDKLDILDVFGVGQEVEVSFNIKGREWTSPQGEVKYFNTLEAWRVEGTVITPPSIISSDSYAFSATVGGTATTPAVQTSAPTVASVNDDYLPF